MPDEPNEPTQTTPEGDEREAAGLPGKGGTTIPVPRKGDVLGALERLAEPKQELRDG